MVVDLLCELWELNLDPRQEQQVLFATELSFSCPNIKVLFSLFLIFDLLLIYFYVLTRMYVCASCVCSTCRGKKRTLDPLGLELQTC